MRRRALPSGKKGVRRRPGRLLDHAPVVYVGPGALPALAGRAGLLLGAHRPGWVDLLAFEPLCSSAGWQDVIERRFATVGDWDVVGIVLGRRDIEARYATILRDLVPGDVVLVRGRQGSKPHGFVHIGDRLARAPLRVTSRAAIQGTTSARPHLRRRYSRSSR